MTTSSGAERRGLLTAVHCLVRSARRPSLAGAPPGLDGEAPLRLVEGGEGLWLVVSDVPAGDYDAASIEAGLRDVDWIARHALAHEHAVEHFLDQGALIPMKLFTLYTSEARALAEVEGRRSALEAVFAEVRGKREWGVRMLAARQANETPPRQERDTSATPGTAFLRGKQAARDAARARSEALWRSAQDLYGELERIAARTRRAERPPESAGTRLVLEGTFLVPTRRTQAFREAVTRGAEEGRAQGLEVVLTGPWAAYHFVEAGA